MELKVGMYVRTKKLLNYDYVSITKIKHIEEKETCLHIWLEDKDLITEKYIIKASYKIISLIEDGDYVNGEKVEDVILDNKMSRIKTTECSTYFEEDIKSIVTKEQFSQMEYKVGD